ncbi:MAG: hypothetical protein ACYTXA_28355 [Nostoc sp.]
METASQGEMVEEAMSTMVTELAVRAASRREVRATPTLICRKQRNCI